MADKAALTRLRREYAIIQQSPKTPHIVARPSELNMLVWHFVLHDLPAESPYRGGVYEGKLVFPQEYPLKPPSIYMITPSGRFEVNTRLCLSMSDFHPESWNPSWRIESILVGLVSFMLDHNEPRTTGGMHASEAKRRELALASFTFNAQRKEFQQLFPEFCDEARRSGDGSFTLAGEVAPSSPEDSKADEVEQPDVPVDPARTSSTLSKALLALAAFVLFLSYLGSRLR